MRIGLVQLSSGPDPKENLPKTVQLIQAAFDAGAELVATPEVTNLVTSDRAIQNAHIRAADQDETLTALRALAAKNRRWILIGSLAVQSEKSAGRFVNRSFLIDARGEITAHYDKIHMFDVTLPNGEVYRESRNYVAGQRAICADTPFCKIGLSICYDLRFPYLYRDLAQAGAKVIFVPSAFAVPTGAAHWHSLLRARAIETGAYIVAPAQTGTHGSGATARKTYGHSLVVSPWGDVLLDAGQQTGHFICELNLMKVDEMRAQIPSLQGDPDYELING